jgi:serine/threonine protein phosphatase PrpC
MDVQQALEIASQTSSGMVRSHNEDSVAYDAACGFVVVADGMGGYNAGEVASGIAISVMTEEIRQGLKKVRPFDPGAEGCDLGLALLQDGLQKANAAIYGAARGKPQLSGMGTTVVSALFYDNRVAVAHVGDSRMYRLRDGAFEAITRDHSLLQEQIDSGMISREDARLSRNKNLVTRAVGIEAQVEVEAHVHEVRVGDLYLLCSDGLNDMLEDADIGEALEMLRANLPVAASQLIEMANDNGGRDNVSVILVKVNGDFAAPQGWASSLLSRFRR